MDLRKFGLSDDDLEALGYRVGKRRGDPTVEASSMSPGPATGRTGTSTGNPVARRWFWTLAILVGVGWFALPAQRMPAPVPANQPDNVFSSARAMSQLVEIARAPRPVGSPEHERVRSFLVDRLQELGLEVTVQTETVAAVDSGAATAATVRNIIARRPGTASTGLVLLTAHYDAAPNSFGAGDDGVGVAAILETVRALAASEGLRNDLAVVVTDAGELGSLGARAFLDATPPTGPAVALTVDPHGVRGPAVWIDAGEGSGGLVDLGGRAVSRPAAHSIVRALDGTLEQSDFDELTARGVPALWLSSFAGRGAHDRAIDRPINVSEATLQHHGMQLLALARALGEEDLTSPGRLAGPRRAYLSLPLVGLVDYPAAWSIPGTIGLVLALVILGLLFRVRGGDVKRALGGLGYGGIVVGASFGLGVGLHRMVASLHPESARVETLAYSEGALALALVALVTTVAVGVYAVARRLFDPWELTVGAVVLPVVTVVVLQLMAPESLVAAQLPVALALLTAIVLVLLPGASRGGWGRIGLLISATAILLCAVPGLDLLIGLRTLAAAPWLAGWMAMAALLLVPVFEWLIHPRAWWTPAVGVVAAAIAVLVSTPGMQGEGRHPIPTSLALLVDDTVDYGHDVAAAPTGAAPTRDTPTEPAGLAAPTDSVGASPSSPATGATSGRRLPGRWLTVPGVGEEWATSWVVDPTGQGEDPGALLMPASARWMVAGVGPGVTVAPPVVRVVGEERRGGTRLVDVDVAPGLDAELVAIVLDDGGASSLIAVEGVPLDSDEPASPVRRLSFWGRPADGVPTVTFRVAPNAESLTFVVLEHHMRPAEILGEDFFQRADSVVADASTGSDRIIQRVRADLPIS